VDGWAGSDSPTNLVELIEYQQNAVVSRTLAGAEAGTVTLFAFDAGQGLSEHTAPYDALVYAVEGSFDITVADSKHAVREGQVLRLPADVPHSVRAERPFKMLLVMIRSR
jgi:quercetin dioxygenase-like cupin family protein